MLSACPARESGASVSRACFMAARTSGGRSVEVLTIERDHGIEKAGQHPPSLRVLPPVGANEPSQARHRLTQGETRTAPPVQEPGLCPDRHHDGGRRDWRQRPHFQRRQRHHPEAPALRAASVTGRGMARGAGRDARPAQPVGRDVFHVSRQRAGVRGHRPVERRLGHHHRPRRAGAGADAERHRRHARRARREAGARPRLYARRRSAQRPRKRCSSHTATGSGSSAAALRRLASR